MNNIVNEDFIDVNHAISHLQQKEVLCFYVQGRVNYVSMKNGEIIISSDNFKSPLSKEDFLSLYQGTEFKVFEDDEEIVDPVKDEQYYSWGRKM